MRVFLFLLLLCLAGCDLSEAPEAVQQSFAQKFPGVTEVQWGIDENGRWEGHFQLDGEKLRADFTMEGNWVETENSISFKDLPEAVKAAIEKEFPKKDITEIEEVDNHEKGVFYDVEFKPKGEEKFDVMFREDGVVIEKNRR